MRVDSDDEVVTAAEKALAEVRGRLQEAAWASGDSLRAPVPRRLSFPWKPDLLGRDVDWKRQLAAEHVRLCARIGDRRRRLPACPVCGEAASKPVTSLNSFEYDSCDGCGHVFMRCQPDEEAVRLLYAASDPADRAVSFKVYGTDELFEKRLRMIAEPKVAFIGEGLRKGARWVDVACGVGEIVAASRAAGWDSRGVESDPEEAAFAQRKGLDVRAGYVDAGNAAELVGDAEMVSLLNVLEHVSSPPGFLRDVSSGLRRGTRVAVEVPRHPSLSLLCNCSFPELAHRHLYAPEHLHVFTERSLVETGRKAGLRPERIWAFGQDFSEIVFSLASRSGNVWPGVAGQVGAILDAVQAIVDMAGLSDKMILVFEKE